MDTTTTLAPTEKLLRALGLRRRNSSPAAFLLRSRGSQCLRERTMAKGLPLFSSVSLRGGCLLWLPFLVSVLLGVIGTACTPQKEVLFHKGRELAHTQPIGAVILKQPDSTAPATPHITYANFPLHFEPNQGQTAEQVNFLARGSGYTLFLTPTEAMLTLRQQAGAAEQRGERREEGRSTCSACNPS